MSSLNKTPPKVRRPTPESVRSQLNWNTRGTSKSELMGELSSLHRNRQNARQSASKSQSLHHELEVQQVELEIQNRELEESHQLLEESRNRYLDLYDFAPTGYATLDSRGTILDLNLTAAVALCSGRENMIGKSLSRWISLGDRLAFSEHLYACERRGQAETVTTELRFCPTGSARSIPMQIHSVPTLDPATGRSVYRTSLVDVSERKRAERAEITAHEMMEERGLRDTFVSVLTHDLRTPLTAIRMCTELLGKEPVTTERSRKLTKRVLNTVDRMDQMIRDLLDVNQIRAGKPLNLRPHNGELDAELRKTIEGLEINHGRRFKFYSQDKIEGRWDFNSLQRAVENLANNAIKYGNPEADVMIRLERTTKGATISVQNSGPRIPESEQRKLFDAFSRTDCARTMMKAGWGLGLTIVKAVAEGHGGRATVVSNERSGTIFSIELPLKGVSEPTRTKH